MCVCVCVCVLSAAWCVYLCVYLPHILCIYYCIVKRKEAIAAIVTGQEQLEILRRQAILSQLYPSARSVME